MDRLRNLEGLVKELRGQLAASTGPISSTSSPKSQEAETPAHSFQSAETTGLHRHFGRMVVQDSNHSRYVSSGFWSRVDDELGGLKMDLQNLGDEDESSGGEVSSARSAEFDRTPSERHAFLFQHNLRSPSPNLHDLHPLPSQVPFLLDVFSENLNVFFQVVHIPTAIKLVRNMRGAGISTLTTSDHALMFSIYYAAVTSMEDEDVVTSFGSSKSDLSLKYRLGLEYALAKADFLNSPDIVLVQAFALFLLLARRHDSPRFVWMMTGLVVRMAQYLGLQRDGTHFVNLTPFEVELRRKVWWVVCLLDVRACEDQGTDLLITSGSFDTKVPLNINDADLEPNSTEMPPERYGITDNSFARVNAAISDTTRQMMARGAKNDVSSLEHQNRLLQNIYRKLEQEYLQHTTGSGNIVYWVTVVSARLVMAKLTLLVFLPVLFSTPSEDMSDEIRDKLLIAAIEVAEYNHQLNSEQACRHWRWIFQTHTHWYAIVYLLIECTRRQWSPMVERAWVALHSCWLIPAKPRSSKDNRGIWVPLRKLMGKGQQHREEEVKRIRAYPAVAAELEEKDRNLSLPSSAGPFPSSSSAEMFRERWRQLMLYPEKFRGSKEASGSTATTPEMVSGHSSQERTSKNTSPHITSQSLPVTAIRQQNHQGSVNGAVVDLVEARVEDQAIEPAYSAFHSGLPSNWTGEQNMGPGFVPWLWTDTDPSVNIFPSMESDQIKMHMNLDENDVDWYNWVETAKGMDWGGPSGPG